MAKLFTSFPLKSINFRNRIAVSPICQYSATDGIANQWHTAHYPAMVRGGAALVNIKASGAVPWLQIAHAGRKDDWAALSTYPRVSLRPSALY